MKHPKLALMILVVAFVGSMFAAYGQIPDVYHEFRNGPYRKTMEIKGVGEVQLGGRYQATATNRNFTAFKEVIERTQSILDSNNVSWDSYKGEVETNGISLDSLESLHFNIATGGHMNIKWEFEKNGTTVIVATLYLYITGYRLEVHPRYL